MTACCKLAYNKFPVLLKTNQPFFGSRISFPRGAPTQKEGVHLLFGKNLPTTTHENEENWTGGAGLKMKKIEREGGRRSKILLCRSATATISLVLNAKKRQEKCCCNQNTESNLDIRQLAMMNTSNTGFLVDCQRMVRDRHMVMGIS